MIEILLDLLKTLNQINLSSFKFKEQIDSPYPSIVDH